MNRIVRFFQRSSETPSHDEVKEKTANIMAGTDPTSKHIKHLNKQYNKQMKKMSQSVKRGEGELLKMKKIIEEDTAFYYAKATGGLS